jgi:hypothetical protein
MAWDERSCARRCRNVWLLDVRIVYGNDHVELRRLLRESRNWLVIGDLPYLAWSMEANLISNKRPTAARRSFCLRVAAHFAVHESAYGPQSGRQRT